MEIVLWSSISNHYYMRRDRMLHGTPRPDMASTVKQCQNLVLTAIRSVRVKINISWKQSVANVFNRAILLLALNYVSTLIRAVIG